MACLNCRIWGPLALAIFLNKPIMPEKKTNLGGEEKMKINLVRLLWWLATFWLPSPHHGFKVENTYSWQELQSWEALLCNLIYCYQQVFSEPPWGESHAFSGVRGHLRYSLETCDGRAAMLKSNPRVVGFAWAAAFASWKEVLEAYVSDSHPALPAETVASLKTHFAALPKTQQPVLFVFELGVLRGHRGLLAVKELISPLLLHYHGCGGMVYWSTPGSRAYSEAAILGAGAVWRGQVGAQEIVFFYLPNVSPLRKAFYHFPNRFLALFVHQTAKVGGLPSRQ